MPVYNKWYFFSVIETLLKHEADPNIGDNFSTVHEVAREKQANSLHGKRNTSLKLCYWHMVFNRLENQGKPGK